VELRAYQQEAIAAVERDWAAGERAVLVVQATGGGKTNVFCSLIARNLSSGRALVLVHRRELVEQARDRLCALYPELAAVTGIVMAEQNDCAARIVFGTVQSLVSEARLASVLEHGQFTICVIDEGHHATASSYRAVLAAIDTPALRVVGVTATPVRADETGLVEVFSKVSATHDIKTLLGLGYLVPPRWLAIQTGIDIGKPTNGDYTAPQLANVFETDNCLDLVVSSHRKFADGRQAIAFLSSVEGAHRLADKFNASGIPAASADANTRKADRARILNGFKRGETQVLCNMGLYTEGLDVPAASCIHQVRPTKSDGLYLQMVGRGLRPFPGKQDCLVLDYAPADSRQIVFLGDVLGAPRREAVVAEVADEDGVLGGFTFDAAGFKWLRGKATELIARQLDYLNTSPWQWYRAPDGSMSLGLGLGSDENERTLFISADTPPRLWAIGKRKDEYNPRVVKLIAESDDFDALMIRADEISDRWGNTVLARKAKKWRREPASDAQLKFARRLGVDGANKGELAEKITHALAARWVEAE